MATLSWYTVDEYIDLAGFAPKLKTAGRMVNREAKNLPIGVAHRQMLAGKQGVVTPPRLYEDDLSLT